MWFPAVNILFWVPNLSRPKTEFLPVDMSDMPSQVCRNPTRKCWFCRNESMTFKMLWVWWATKEVALVARLGRRLWLWLWWARFAQLLGGKQMFPFTGSMIYMNLHESTWIYMNLYENYMIYIYIQYSRVVQYIDIVFGPGASRRPFCWRPDWYFSHLSSEPSSEPKACRLLFEHLRKHDIVYIDSYNI